MILLLDNYDSFTYNLYQYLSEESRHVTVKRNDQITLEEIEQMKPEAVIISPGPGLPNESGICLEAVQHFHQSIPILGVCLGQQCIAQALGGSLRPAKVIMHGKTSPITHNASGLYQGLPNPVEVMRYHSYVIDRLPASTQLEIESKSDDDQEIMGIKHQEYPVYGVQFHPESIGTTTGKDIIRNFLNVIREESNLSETIS
ncbi:anthranilate synthase component II [Virgibacillus xinjiangensis]|uniref:Anthranilate synthase component II n=1 Tax=Virgibacillus xinjiangensis TaxID=393090 RepID=A0ABV7CYS2_9BACI